MDSSKSVDNSVESIVRLSQENLPSKDSEVDSHEVKHLLDRFTAYNPAALKATIAKCEQSGSITN